ncbi:MAG: hypothetical protein Q4F00_11315 [bacterium]|nr:hypothetical protein [bacterium]
MFVAILGWGAVGGVIGIGVAEIEDHIKSKSKYSKYADEAMLTRIKEKESELHKHKSQLGQLRRQIIDSLDDTVKNWSEDKALVSFIPFCHEIKGKTELEKIDVLYAKTVQNIEKKLQEDIRDDEKELQQIDLLLQKINDLRFQ